MFSIADSKKENGDWDWRTFGTGSGFVADLIVSGVIRLAEELTVENDDGTVQLTSSGVQVTDTGVAQAIIKAGQIALQAWDSDSGTWVNGLYFDIATGKFVFDGTLSANVIEAIEAEIDVIVNNTFITQNLYTEYGRIANLTVSELDTSWKKITNYLDTDPDVKTAPVYYTHDYEQYKKWIVAETDGSETEQVKDRFDNPLY